VTRPALPDAGRASPGTVDAVLVGVLLTFLIGFAVVVGTRSINPWTWMFIGAVQIVPLLWRRQAPLLVAGIIAAGCLLQLSVMTESHPANLAVPIAVFSAAAHGTRTESAATVALGLVGALLAAMRWTAWSNSVIFLGLLGILSMIVILSWLTGDVTRRRLIVQSRAADQQAALARDEAQRSRLAVQDERAAIAREMHDVVAHSLAVVVVQADGALYAARTALDQPPQVEADRAALEQAATTLETLAETARSSLAETRRLVGVLREEGAGAEYAPFQGLADLDRLADGMRDSGREIQVAMRGRIDDLSREVDQAAYRVVQESLTNVLKHAGPSVRVDVDVLRTPAVLLVRVTDNGPTQGSSPDGTGHGILGMTERIEVLGGSLHAGPRPQGGWEVVATIPAAPTPAGPPHTDPSRSRP